MANGNDYDTLILGAGMAGLSAAWKLAAAGARVLVIEARDRVGGRIFTRHYGENAVELGAEFVHGMAPELWNLILDAGLESYETGGTHFCFEFGELKECNEILEDDWKQISNLESWHGRDIPFADFIRGSEVGAQTQKRLTDYVEGFNAADERRIGVASLARQQAAENAIEGDRAFIVRGGYAQIPEFLARKVRGAGGMILLQSQVTRVEWKRGTAAVTCTVREGKREVFRAKRVVVALPLGVLQSEAVKFAPEPAEMFRALARLEVGQVCKITLRFRERFWTDARFRLPQSLAQLSFLHSPGSVPQVWWTRFPDVAPILVAWMAGPRAARNEAIFAGNPSRELLENLAGMLNVDSDRIRELLVGYDMHDWQRDPFAVGAYSYVHVDAMDAIEQLMEPVEDTLFFAGEHTDSRGHWGTVHGAIHSGMRAAKQILNVDSQ